jgi:protein TonB
MRSKIAACAVANGILIAVSVFAQNPDTKPDKTSQTAPVARAQPYRIRVNEDVQKAKLVHTVFPMYPPVSYKRMDGTVVLHIVIGKSGAVKSAKYVSGPANLMNSAVNAVLQWRYEPTLMKGVPVEVDTTVSVLFSPLTKEPPVASK